MKTWKQVTEARYWEMLGCVPPALMTSLGFLVGEAYDHSTCTVTRTIRPTYRAFAEINGKFYEGPPLTIAEFRQTKRETILEAA